MVEQFKYDLKEMGVVQDLHLFSGRGVLHGCIRDAQTADEYVSQVFVPIHLPARMTTKAFLSMALDLFDPSSLRARIIDNLLRQTKVVPTATVHARAVQFSRAFRTVLIGGPLSAATVSPLDAQRLVIAASQLLDDNFTLSRKEMNAVQKCRPHLTTCLVEALRKARSRTGSFRNVLRVVVYTTMFLADKEDLLSWKPDLPKFYSKYSIHRFLLVRELKQIVTAAMEVEERLLDEDDGGTRRQIALSAISNCTVAVNRITATRRH